ncbi:HotDog domain-containing protein [Xylariaceae sp. FL0016]|nr:HotDog domain-containing protein [Xylariaceae sp. FL0016]
MANRMVSTQRDHMMHIEDAIAPAWEHYMAKPWCASHLQHADISPWCPPWLRPPQDVRDDPFWSKTLSTPDTVSAFLLFYHRPPRSNARVDELKGFLDLEWGVGGYPATAHGGITTVVFDEVLGLHGRLNHERKAFGGAFMTAYLNTSFLQPVKLPSTVLVISRLAKYEDRKLLMTGEIQDEKGVVLAKAEALFVVLKNRL